MPDQQVLREGLAIMYRRSYRVLQKERMMRVQMREQALGDSMKREWQAKIAEIDLVLRDMTTMKDALKLFLGIESAHESQPVYQQDALLDLPPVPVKSY